MRKYLSISFSIFVLLAIIPFLTLKADSPTFVQSVGLVNQVNLSARTFTVEYPQISMMAYCNPAQGAVCPTQPPQRQPDTVSFDQVLVTDISGQIIVDITKLKTGSSVTVYLKNNLPYAVRDNTMNNSQTNWQGGVITSVPPATAVGSTGGGSAVNTYPSSVPANPSCIQRPACLDATPRCMIAEPASGWCQNIEGGGATNPGAYSQSNPGYTITSNLSAGVQSDQVKLLQIKLRSLGYFPADIEPSGYFGSVTKQAVINFQQSMGLPTTGYVGPMTRSALDK